MSDAIINGKTFKAPDLTTHFKIINDNGRGSDRAVVTKEINGREVFIGGVSLSSSTPAPELAEKLEKLVTSHGFLPEGPRIAA